MRIFPTVPGVGNVPSVSTCRRTPLADLEGANGLCGEGTDMMVVGGLYFRALASIFGFARLGLLRP
jgi:hypothetical protein